ncbi:MAG: hypothetical protein ACFE0I_18285 [Elainellaceae cyanobacterium]
MKARPKFKRTKTKKSLWFERLMAITALINLCLVAFDISYIPLRDFYLRRIPQLTQWYGRQVKGIEPHRETTAYLNAVNELEEQLEQQGEAALETTQTQQLLQELRVRSDDMIDENPFQVADKSGTLERIKNRMRDRIDVDSSKDAFTQFWDADYLSSEGWRQEIAYFNQEIRPLIETNYYRGIGEDGRPIDEFWRVDIWFVAIFGIEFLARTLYLSIRYKGTNWFDAMLWRWYDVLLLIPFWRWLRVIPVTVRLHQSRLVNLAPIQSRITRGLVASVAVELTEIVVIRIIDQMQNLIRQGDVARWILNPEPERRYIDINGVDEIQAISQRIVMVLVYRVLPQLKPEMEAVLAHSVGNAVHTTPVYQGFQAIPGFSNIPDQLTKQLAAEVTKNAYSTLTNAMEDSVGAELTQKLILKLGETLREEIQQENTVEELEYLLTVLLEEIKINYVKRIPDEELDQLEDQAYKLYEVTQIGKNRD